MHSKIKYMLLSCLMLLPLASLTAGAFVPTVLPFCGQPLGGRIPSTGPARFAVVASPLVFDNQETLDRSIQQARMQGDDFLAICGGFVEDGARDSYAFAIDEITEHSEGLAVLLVPGHGDLVLPRGCYDESNFRAAFGSPYRELPYKGMQVRTFRRVRELAAPPALSARPSQDMQILLVGDQVDDATIDRWLAGRPEGSSCGLLIAPDARFRRQALCPLGSCTGSTGADRRAPRCLRRHAVGLPRRGV